MGDRGKGLRGLVTACLAASLLAACGGGGDTAGDGAPAAPPAPVRIEAGPAAALLKASGESRRLQAQLLDAAGQPVAGTISWTSSNPAVVSVDAAGTVRAEAATGSARIVASAGTLRSEPIVVTVAQPAAGARLVPDSAVVGVPALPVSGAAGYEVVLHGLPALTVGEVLIASESAPVAGRVLEVQVSGADQRVRLGVLPPQQLFAAVAYDETTDAAAGELALEPELAAAYDVSRNGNTFVFTPKPGALATLGAMKSAPGMQAATGTHVLPPFRDCKVEGSFGSGLPLPLSLSAAPAFEVTIDGTVRHTADAQGTRFVVTGQPKFRLGAELEVRSAFEAKVSCSLTLVRRQFRAPGWAGIVFGGDIEYGVGFEVGGKVTLASAKVGGSARIDATVSATLDCPAGADCALSGNVTAPVQITPTLRAPSLANLQFEPSVNLFGFVKLEAGNAFLEQLQFEALEAKAGAELGASLTLEAVQIDNADPDAGRSKYALAFKGEVGPGLKLGEFFEYVGLARAVPLKLAFSHDLGTSPAAASVSADRASYLQGERVTLNVRLAPDSVRFPTGGLYNVERVVVQRRTGILETQRLAEVVPTAEGQTEFTLSFDAPGPLTARELFVFVATSVLPLDPPLLELAVANAFDIVAPGARNAVRGQPFEAALQALGGQAPLSWSAVGLPPGLQIGAATGVLNGSASQSGVYPVQVSARSADGRSASVEFQLTVTEFPLVEGAYWGTNTILTPWDPNIGRSGPKGTSLRQSPSGQRVLAVFDGWLFDIAADGTLTFLGFDGGDQDFELELGIPNGFSITGSIVADRLTLLISLPAPGGYPNYLFRWDLVRQPQ